MPVKNEGLTKFEAARYSPAGFAACMRSKYVFADHLRPIDDALYDTVYGDCKRLIVTMPRRHGKTFTISETFALWFIGNMERIGRSVEVMVCSYNQSKSNDISRSLRDLFKHPDFNRIFPQTRLKEGNQDVEQWSTVNGSRFYAVGVGGSCTGRGAHLLLIDDSIKNAEEALSNTHRHKLVEWYQTGAYNSMYEDGVCIHVGTRWHSEDLIGHCLKQDSENDENSRDEWRVIHQQAIIDEGTEQERALWPRDEAHGVGFSLDYLKRLRAKSGARWWSTQYRGIPIDVGADCLGDPIRGEGMPPRLLCFVDTAFDGQDSTAWCIGGLIGDKLHIVRADIKRRSSVDLAPEIAGICRDFGVRSVIVEKNADKGWTGQAIRKHGLHVIDAYQTKNKIGRIQLWVQSDYKERFVFSQYCSPAFIAALASWSELAAHDDAADCVAGLAEHLLDKSRHVQALPAELFRG